MQESIPDTRLVTIPLSVYCEKVRWALERLEIDYAEETHLQGIHYARAYQLSGRPSVPILVHGGEAISGSERILRHLDLIAPPPLRLYPAEAGLRRRAERLERLFDSRLGPEARRWLYFHALSKPAPFVEIATRAVPAWESVLFRASFRLLRRAARMGLSLDEQSVERGLDHVRRIVAETDGLYIDGRAYLVGGRFSVADLTLACMLAPFVIAPEYARRLPGADALPRPMRSTIAEFRATRTGRAVLRLFELERGRAARERRKATGRLVLDRLSPHSV